MNTEAVNFKEFVLIYQPSTFTEGPKLLKVKEKLFDNKEVELPPEYREEAIKCIKEDCKSKGYPYPVNIEVLNRFAVEINVSSHFRDTLDRLNQCLDDISDILGLDIQIENLGNHHRQRVSALFELITEGEELYDKMLSLRNFKVSLEDYDENILKRLNEEELIEVSESPVSEIVYHLEKYAGFINMDSVTEILSALDNDKFDLVYNLTREANSPDGDNTYMVNKKIIMILFDYITGKK